MQTKDFDFFLPEQLIARYPKSDRSSSRLFVVRSGDADFEHRQFSDIQNWLNPPDILVLNNTKVMNARLFGVKETGGKIECLVERVLTANTALVHIKSSKSPKCGARIAISVSADHQVDYVLAEVLSVKDGLFTLKLAAGDWHHLMSIAGHVPLPPYMKRPDELEDRDRYQTVYASKPGAVAAPTAGLHFSVGMLDGLRAKGVKVVEITLHVGAGTFQPVRVDHINHHQMHAEQVDISQQAVDAIMAAKQAGGRVVAVGTTTVRSLETAALVATQSGSSTAHLLSAFRGDSTLFIYPGFTFRVVDVMITNFHLPQSTLLMLVSAFAGQKRILAAYEEAVREGYRFFSYGDAMWLERGV